MMIRIAKVPWRLTLQDSHGQALCRIQSQWRCKEIRGPDAALWGRVWMQDIHGRERQYCMEGPLLPTAIARPQYNSSPAPLLPPRASELTLTLDGFLWQVRRTNQDTVLFLCCGRKAGILKEHTLETVEGDLPLWAGLLAVMQFMDSEGEPPLV